MVRRCPTLEQAASALVYALHVYLVAPLCKTIQGCYETIDGGRTRRRQIREHEEALKRLKEECERLKPKPLPPVRPRRLTRETCEETYGIEDTIPERELGSTSQENSLFLTKLSLDIRREIYRHVIGYGLVHIARAKGRLGCVRCKVRNSPFPKDRECLEAACYKDEIDEHWGLFKGNSGSNSGILSLSKTCRMLYSETIDDLYSLNTFVFPSTTQFLEFSQMILPQRLNAITRIDMQVNIGKLSLPKPEPDLVHDQVSDGIDPPKVRVKPANTMTGFVIESHMSVKSQPPDIQWRQAIGLLAGMRSLRVLRVDIECTPHVRFKIRTGLVDVLETIIQPWASIKQVEVFEIQVEQILRDPLIKLVQPASQPAEHIDRDNTSWEANLIRDRRGRWELEGKPFPMES